jgi:hypothetical protein
MVEKKLNINEAQLVQLRKDILEVRQWQSDKLKEINDLRSSAAKLLQEVKRSVASLRSIPIVPIEYNEEE